MFNKLRSKNTEIKSLAKVIADLREGLEMKDNEIEDLKAALAEERRRRVSLAERFMEYQKHSVAVPTINMRW